MNRSHHQYFAMVAAKKVAAVSGIAAKEKARGECLVHLRASLLPVLAGSVNNKNNQVQL
jgi:hypothetical protein